MPSNPSYIRFENTLRDLRDCYDHLNDELSETSEEESRKRLIKLCHKIADETLDTEQVVSLINAALISAYNQGRREAFEEAAQAEVKMCAQYRAEQDRQAAIDRDIRANTP
jgi:hypothetical protein